MVQIKYYQSVVGKIGGHQTWAPVTVMESECSKQEKKAGNNNQNDVMYVKLFYSNINK